MQETTPKYQQNQPSTVGGRAGQSPSDSGQAVESPTMYLHANLYVKPENQEEFATLSPLYAEVIFQRYGYELVHASYPQTGVVDVFRHVWRVAPDRGLGDVMIATAKEAKREVERETRLEAAIELLDAAKSRLSGQHATASKSALSESEAAALKLLRAGTPTEHNPLPPRKVSNRCFSRLTRALEAIDTPIARDLVGLCSLYHDEFDRQQKQHNSNSWAMATAEAADGFTELAGRLALAAYEEATSHNATRYEAYAGVATIAIELARRNRTIPGVPSPFTRIQQLIDRTEQQLTTALPYDPVYFGQQSQTIIVADASGAQPDVQLWLIEHKELKAQEQLQVPSELRDTPRWRTLLQHGATVATLDENSKLFNIAGLRSKSVFQRQQHAVPGDTLKGAPDDEPPTIKDVYLPMPWGEIYKLDGAAVARIGRKLTETEHEHTKQLMHELLAAKVELAAIPEVREEDIGQGYYCYVVNLSSYVPPSEEAATAAAE